MVGKMQWFDIAAYGPHKPYCWWEVMVCAGHIGCSSKPSHFTNHKFPATALRISQALLYMVMGEKIGYLSNQWEPAAASL